MNQTVPKQVVVDTNTLKTVTCICGNTLFDQVNLYKIVPSLYSQTGKTSLLALHHLRCVKCGKVRSIDEILAEENKTVLPT